MGTGARKERSVMSKYLCEEIDIWAKNMQDVEDVAARLDIPVVSTEIWSNGRATFRFEAEDETLCRDLLDILVSEGIEVL